jgi:predicted ArsR family transcriptional regulator
MGCVYLFTNRINGLMYDLRKEIAAVLGCSDTAVQVKLARLRRDHLISSRRYVRQNTCV